MKNLILFALFLFGTNAAFASTECPVVNIGPNQCAHMADYKRLYNNLDHDGLTVTKRSDGNFRLYIPGSNLRVTVPSKTIEPVGTTTWRCENNKLIREFTHTVSGLVTEAKWTFIENGYFLEGTRLDLSENRVYPYYYICTP